MIFRPNP